MIKLRVLDILEKQGHSKYWLFKRMAPMSYQNFNNLVTNKTTKIKFDTIELLANALECPIGDLFEIVAEDNSEII